MSVLSEEHCIATYEGANGEPFHIYEIGDARHALTKEDLVVCAEGICNVLRTSWTQKFVPNEFNEDDLDTKIPSTQEQAARILKPHRGARYLLAANEAASGPQAFIRVESYRPRSPLKRPYPNVTDLETLDGRIAAGPYHLQAAALLLHGLGGWESSRPVSAYAEAPNKDGRRFYETYGLVIDDSMGPEQLTEAIGKGSLTYAHMVSDKGVDVGTVRQNIIAEEGFKAHWD